MTKRRILWGWSLLAATTIPYAMALPLPDPPEIEGYPLHDLLPPDAIRALHEPPTVGASQAGFLRDQTLVLGVETAGEARAYSLAQLTAHEVINDRLADREIVVTW